jgi:ribosome-binding protein aMBF1 (putative translation factor)
LPDRPFDNYSDEEEEEEYDEDEDEEGESRGGQSQPKEMSRKLVLEIIKARQKRGLTRAQLAQRIGEKVKVIDAYETGTAIPSKQIIIHIENVLNVKLTQFL